MVEKDEENSSEERKDGKEDIERLWSADEIVFIKLDVPTKPNQDYLMSAIRGGKLTVDEEGCLRINRGYLPVWPYEYSLRDRKGEVVVLDEKGNVVARVGSRVSMGGGEVKSKELRRELDVPGKCRGILWPVTPPVNIYPERTVMEE